MFLKPTLPSANPILSEIRYILHLLLIHPAAAASIVSRRPAHNHGDDDGAEFGIRGRHEDRPRPKLQLIIFMTHRVERIAPTSYSVPNNFGLFSFKMVRVDHAYGPKRMIVLEVHYGTSYPTLSLKLNYGLKSN